MSVGQAKNVTGLGSGEPLEVAKDEDVALRGGKGVDGINDDLPSLQGEELVLRCLPGDRLYRPVVRPSGVVCAEET